MVGAGATGVGVDVAGVAPTGSGAGTIAGAGAERAWLGLIAGFGLAAIIRAWAWGRVARVTGVGETGGELKTMRGSAGDWDADSAV